MASNSELNESFSRIATALRETDLGSERTMYGPIRDLFREVLGHGPDSVKNEPTLQEGAPDLLVSIPHPGQEDDELPVVIIEAKDERGSVEGDVRREEILQEKAKYLTFSTQWFVLIDPEAILARPVKNGEYGEGDIAFRWDHEDGLKEFYNRFSRLTAEQLGFGEELEAFRGGATDLIASIDISEDGGGQSARQFFDALRDGASTLQAATRSALDSVAGQLEEIREQAEEFRTEFSEVSSLQVEVDPIRITGNPAGTEQTRRFHEARTQFERFLRRTPRLTRLALRDLEDLSQRAEVGDDREKLFDLLATETANLILARVLLIRFFEDHEFFGEARYVCNGGLEAVRHVMDYFDHTYTYLLRTAYDEASEFYSAAFADTPFDWILADETETFSRSLEWVLFVLSRFNFRSVRGDLLSGIYERFLDRKRRKKFGEFYTPPSIARYMLSRLDLEPGDRVLDPACGSGTFLIEAYEMLGGERARRGVAGWRECRTVATSLAGNDINPFAAVLSQIQLLWHLLPFRDRILEDGFPEMDVSEGANALRVRDLLSETDHFAELDTDHYAAVTANPPYVRSERQTGQLDRDSQRFYEDEISADTNLWTLFLYRALRSWCRPGDDDRDPGRVAYIVPLAFAEAKNQAAIRRLFHPEHGVWRIREIVDLEQIGPLIFDADVVPIILIAERRAPAENDTIRLRIADQSVVRPGIAGGQVQFDLDSASTVELDYEQVFAPDGRVRTRLTERRHEILTKLERNAALTDAARPFYVRRGRYNRLEEGSTDPSVLERPTENWESRTMLSGGIAFRGTYEETEDGVDVYKGENILSLGLTGEDDPPYPATRMEAVDDPSLWRFPEVLPNVAYAVPQIEMLPNAVCFDPHEIAFTNTATIFVPQEDFESFPFDLLLHSRVYRWAYAFGYRMGVLYRRRSHMYPENIGQLPWSEDLLEFEAEIEALRDPLTEAYLLEHDEETAFEDLMDGLDLRSLSEVALDFPNLEIQWGDLFTDPEYEVEVTPVSVSQPTDGSTRIHFGENLFDWIDIVGDGPIGTWIALALQAHQGQRMGRGDILDMPVPADADEADRLEEAFIELFRRDPEGEKEEHLSRLDHLVGEALGLGEEDVIEIQRDLREDLFIRTLGVREPYTETQLVGVRDNLTRSDRYE